MEGQHWTVDTGVLYKAADVDMDASFFLLRVLHVRDLVAFDSDGHIEREYRRCLHRTERRGGSRLLKEWLRTVTARLAIKFSGRLAARHATAFRAMGFDRDDWPFVGVCSRTASRKLVSEDSDYTPEVRDYLSAEFGVSVLSVEEALRP